jgi:hypothetical protein
MYLGERRCPGDGGSAQSASEHAPIFYCLRTGYNKNIHNFEIMIMMTNQMKSLLKSSSIK